MVGGVEQVAGVLDLQVDEVADRAGTGQLLVALGKVVFRQIELLGQLLQAQWFMDMGLHIAMDSFQIKAGVAAAAFSRTVGKAVRINISRIGDGDRWRQDRIERGVTLNR